MGVKIRWFTVLELASYSWVREAKIWGAEASSEARAPETQVHSAYPPPATGVQVSVLMEAPRAGPVQEESWKAYSFSWVPSVEQLTRRK